MLCIYNSYWFKHTWIAVLIDKPLNIIIFYLSENLATGVAYINKLWTK